MTLLLLKILLAPIIITACTLAGRRFGHAVGGVIIGLPLTSGPVALLIALQNGKHYVVSFSNGLLMGITFVAIFSIVYAYLSARNHWIISTIAGWMVYGICAYMLYDVKLSLFVTFVVVILSLILIVFVFPKGGEVSAMIKAPRWDIPVRILVATGLIFTLTELSRYVDTHLIGIMSTFPVYCTIFGASSHYHYGSKAAVSLLKGIVVGSFSFATFFLILGTTIVDAGIAFSFLLAIAAALLLQFILYKLKVYKFNSDNILNKTTIN